MLSWSVLLLNVTKVFNLVVEYLRDADLISKGKELQRGESNAAMVKYLEEVKKLDDDWVNNPAVRDRMRTLFGYENKDIGNEPNDKHVLSDLLARAEVLRGNLPEKQLQVPLLVSARFSDRSASRLLTCDPRLVAVLNTVVSIVDCTVICGHRNEEEQNRAFAEGKSKLKWPKSKHNSNPSKAADVAPYPIDWNNTARFVYFAGIVMAVAKMKGVELRWGGDWNKNYDPNDESFRDLVHFEIDGE